VSGVAERSESEDGLATDLGAIDASNA